VTDIATPAGLSDPQGFPQRLLARLDDIGRSLAQTSQALALIGLGSVGLELDRLDAYSDLDFFAIVRAGQKARFVEHLDWLESIAPVVYAFRNTSDGYKLLFADGIFCEFAVFEPDELAGIPFAPGRIVWKAAEVDETIARPASMPSAPGPRSTEWLLGEALSNLVVGLGRYRRGERLSAARFVQQYAVDRVLELAAQIEAEQPGFRDVFAGERRFEARFPGIATVLPQFVQGYERTPESAAAILIFLERHFAVNPALAAAIRQLCDA
jgi:hypothetical protein